jgi:two-component system, OmpR family, response regulator VicR
MIMSRKILLIDDEIDVFHLLHKLLAPDDIQVEWAAHARSAIQKIESREFDLVLLDIIMPETNGMELCRAIRAFSDIPIIFFTTLNRESEIIRGLRYGADDYIIKPVSKPLLLARIEAVLRRYQSHQTPITLQLPKAQGKVSVYHDGYLTLDCNSRKVLIDGRAVRLTATESKLLTYLFQNAGHIRSFEQILEAVWEQSEDKSIAYIHTYISRLRHKLEKDPNAPTYLLSAYGIGYCFEKQREPSHP